MKKIGVVIVDDSALIRNLLSGILNSDPQIHVLGVASDPYIARDLIKKTNPDVITLDVEMPKMDGLSFLDKIMRLRPTPVIMISSLTQKGAEITLKALEIGAIDYIGKPQIGLEEGINKLSAEIIFKIKTAANANVCSPKTHAIKKSPISCDIAYKSTEKIIALGASTGGVEALTHVICEMPADCPATVIVQHMPKNFTSSFANRLNGLATPNVLEAQNGGRLMPGHVYIAPGDLHMIVKKSGADYIYKLEDGPLVSGHKPSVDHMFYSIAKSVGENAVGGILTGMGSDGADGLLKMKNAGAKTIGQDEASATIYGMPKAAFEIGAVEKQVNLQGFAKALLSACGEGNVRVVRV